MNLFRGPTGSQASPKRQYPVASSQLAYFETPDAAQVNSLKAEVNRLREAFLARDLAHETMRLAAVAGLVALHRFESPLWGDEFSPLDVGDGSIVPVPDVRKLPLAGRMPLTEIATAATSARLAGLKVQLPDAWTDGQRQVPA